MWYYLSSILYLLLLLHVSQNLTPSSARNLPWPPEVPYNLFLAIRCSAFYYTNNNNTFSHSVPTSNNTECLLLLLSTIVVLDVVNFIDGICESQAP